MKKIYRLILTVVFCVVAVGSATAQNSSVYTNLTGGGCRAFKSDPETGSSEKRCGGYGKWSLMVLDDDDRMSVNVLSPDAKQYELNFWTVVTPAFSSLGNKAEWRVQKQGNTLQPIALIVRINTTSEANGRREKQSYLAVSKITDGEICVVEKISNQKNANQMARTAADNAAAKQCLQPE